MKYIYTNKEAKAIDRHAIGTVGMSGLVLMEKAAMSVAAIFSAREKKGTRVLAVCGTGITVAMLLLPPAFYMRWDTNRPLQS